MTITQQRLHSLKAFNLKNLQNLEMSFDGHPVTAILGPNGNGKSTVLHALASAFSPNSIGENYKFSSFFLPNPDALWNGSSMEILHSYRDAQVEHNNVTREYKKTNTRWTPRYKNRPKRDIFYIGIDKCVPLIESEKKQVKINYSTKAFDEDALDKILEKASLILNRRYSKYNIHTAAGKKFIGVEVDDLRYSALSMSAGEQKVFYILEKLFKAPKYSLILIDELDLLLHDMALKRLIGVISERSIERNIQVIFTTHRETIIDLSHLVNIRHIVSMQGKSLCFNETKPDAINRLTGTQPKTIEIFVEDDLSVAVVTKIAAQLKILRHVSTNKFGAAINCFTTVAGLMLGGEKCENTIFALDGDVYRSDEEKIERLNKVITGHDQNAISCKEQALTKICQFRLPCEVKPEPFLHSLICDTIDTGNSELNEIIEISKEIIVADDSHGYINEIIIRLGLSREVGLSKIVDLLSHSPGWDDYVFDIKKWLQGMVGDVVEVEATNPQARD